MLYIFLLSSDRTIEQQPLDDILSAHTIVADRARSRNAYIHSEALAGSESATTVRVRGGKVTLTDGPFAETKEVMGGFYILDCKDLDEALEYARDIPNASTGAVEVRPIMRAPDWKYAVAADRERLPMS